MTSERTTPSGTYSPREYQSLIRRARSEEEHGGLCTRCQKKLEDVDPSIRPLYVVGLEAPYSFAREAGDSAKHSESCISL